MSILIVACCEILCGQKIAIAGVSPNFLVIFVMFFGMFYGVKQGFQTGLLAGFLLDLLGVNFFGISIISYILIGSLCGLVGDKIYRESPFTQIISVFFCSMILSKLNILYSSYTAALAPFIFFILNEIFFQREGDPIF